jgi:hypothetical protein
VWCDGSIRAINSLPFYVNCSGLFFVLYGEQTALSGTRPVKESELDAASLSVYKGRGWCRCEVLAAMCPRKTDHGDEHVLMFKCNFLDSSEDTHVSKLEAFVADPLALAPESNFTNDEDRKSVVKLVEVIAKELESLSSHPVAQEEVRLALQSHLHLT